MLQSLEIKDTWQPFEVCVASGCLRKLHRLDHHTPLTATCVIAERCSGLRGWRTGEGTRDDPIETWHCSDRSSRLVTLRCWSLDMQEGLNTLTFTRHVSVMSITLSTVPLDSTRPGYQAPLPLDQVKPLLPPSRSHPGAALVPRSASPTHTLHARFRQSIVCAQRMIRVPR